MPVAAILRLILGFLGSAGARKGLSSLASRPGKIGSFLSGKGLGPGAVKLGADIGGFIGGEQLGGSLFGLNDAQPRPTSDGENFTQLSNTLGMAPVSDNERQFRALLEDDQLKQNLSITGGLI